MLFAAKLLPLLLLLAVASPTSFGKQERPTRPCTGLFSSLAAKLKHADSVRRSIHIKNENKPFDIPDPSSNEERMKTLRDFREMGIEKQNALMREELARFILNEPGLIKNERADAFHRVVKQFIEDGGVFAINRDIEPKTPHIFIGDDGSFYISVPHHMPISTRFDLSKEASGDLMRALVHELRHYVTHTRQVRARRDRGLKAPRQFLGRLSSANSEAFALFMEQMEREAKIAENTFMPGSRETRASEAFYSEAEAIHRRLKAMNLENNDTLVARISSDPVLKRMGDSLASAVVDYYTSYHDGRELPFSVRHRLSGYLYAKKVILEKVDEDRNLPFEWTVSQGNTSDALMSVFGRIPKEQVEAVSPVLEKQMYLRKREIVAAIEKLISLHPELKPWGE